MGFLREILIRIGAFAKEFSPPPADPYPFSPEANQCKKHDVPMKWRPAPLSFVTLYEMIDVSPRAMIPVLERYCPQCEKEQDPVLCPSH